MNYLASAINFLITYGFAFLGSIPAFGMTIIMMNGFHENDAQYGIYAFWGWIIVVGLIVGLVSAISGYLLAEKKEVNPFVSALVAMLIFFVVQAVVVIVAVIICLFTADIVRRNF